MKYNITKYQNPAQPITAKKRLISREEKNSMDFYQNWLNQRKDVLGKNIQDSYDKLSWVSKVDDYFSPSINLRPSADEEIKEQVSTMRAAKSYDLKYPVNFQLLLNNNKKLADIVFENANTDTGAFRHKRTNEIVYYDFDMPENEKYLHERTHAAKPAYQKSKIREFNDNTNLKDIEADSYYEDPDEIYSRLMEFRKLNKLNPLQKFNLKDLNRLKNSGKDVEILNRYNDKFILYLLNDVASTDNKINYAKLGGII